MIKNWLENKEYCKKLCNENPKLLSKKETKGGFSGDYITWTLVYKWLVKNYDFNFEVIEVKTSQDGSNGYVKAKLHLTKEYIYDKDKKLIETNEINEIQTLALTLETFKRTTGDFYQESPEQLQMRVFVKLVANLTGFGFHLWEK